MTRIAWALFLFVSTAYAQGVLTVTTTSLPAGEVTVAYSQTLQATGGTLPYTWSLSSGSLPDGLTLSAGGVISGTPTTAQSRVFVAQVSDAAAGSDTQVLSINVIFGGPTITTTSMPGGEVTVPYSETLQATDGTLPYTWSLVSGSLPDGLMLSAGGVISGTPTTPGLQAFTVEVTDAVLRSDTQLLAISIVFGGPTITTTSLPGGEVTVPYSETLQATDGTLSYTWSLVSGSLPDGLMLSAGGVISGTPTTPGLQAFTVQVTDAVARSDTQLLAISIVFGGPTITTTSLPSGEVTVPYSETLEATDGTLPYTWSLVSGSLPDGLMLSAGGVISGTPTTPGLQAFTVQVTDAVARSDTQLLAISIVFGGPTITTTSLPGGEVTVPYSETLEATDGTLPYTWSLVSGSLPDGLALSAGGVISGTPTTAGLQAFTVQVTDAVERSDTQLLAINIVFGGPTITTTSLPDGEIGLPYSQALQATGGTPPYGWSLSSGSLPDGLTLSADGTISGTPTTAQTSGFTVQVTDNAAASDTQSLSITISAVGPTITTTSLPDGEVGMPYSQMLEATGGTPPHSWSLSSGSLPNGLTLSADGMISGTPTTAQSRAFTVRVTDDASAPATRSLSITINAVGGPMNHHRFASRRRSGNAVLADAGGHGRHSTL